MGVPFAELGCAVGKSLLDLNRVLAAIGQVCCLMILFDDFKKILIDSMC